MAAGPACREPVLRNGRGHHSERPAYRKKKKKRKWGSFHKWVGCALSSDATQVFSILLLASGGLLAIFFFFSFFAVRGPLTVVASPVAEHSLRTRRPSGHGSRAQPLRGMWDLPGPGHEPVCPASAGGLSTTALPGKPFATYFNI